MANEVINIGCKIEIRAENRRLMTEETSEPEVYISQFLQWLDTNVAVIVVPTFKGYLVPLRVDEVYDLQFVTKSGLYRCRGKIMKRKKATFGLNFLLPYSCKRDFSFFCRKNA